MSNYADTVRSPAFVVEVDKLRANCALLADVQARSGAKILLALKGFATWSVFPEISQLLAGTTASGSHEARLGREEFGGEVHVYSPAYTEQDFRESLTLCDHMTFNSFGQWLRFRPECRREAELRSVHFGLRVNPEHSEVNVPLYDPCRSGSRLGVPSTAFAGQDLDGISGLHFHTLCESGVDALERTLEVVEKKWSKVLPLMNWVNFGGGHHITQSNYDVERLVALIRRFSARYDVQVYLEPGEAVALNAGVLVSSVVDVVENGGKIALLDVSATAHMPDVLEMPYRPRVVGAAEPGQIGYDYRLAGSTCLAGDEIGVYSFSEPLSVGTSVVFEDMAIYSMVKTTMFNGVPHPAIVLAEPGKRPRIVRRFTYEDYRNRLS